MNSHNKTFINFLIDGAKEGHKLYGVPASVSMAQAILESGWGKKAPGNNLFGIKADTSWKGKTINFPTHEIIRGVRVYQTCRFRAYDSFGDSMKDHAAFLVKNERYKSAFECGTGCEFAKAIAEAGYATDPAYADLLVAIITHNNLEQYD